MSRKVLGVIAGLGASAMLASAASASLFFVDNFANDIVRDSDSVPTYWEDVSHTAGTWTETGSASVFTPTVEALTGINTYWGNLFDVAIPTSDAATPVVYKVRDISIVGEMNYRADFNFLSKRTNPNTAPMDSVQTRMLYTQDGNEATYGGTTKIYFGGMVDGKLSIDGDGGAHLRGTLNGLVTGVDLVIANSQISMKAYGVTGKQADAEAWVFDAETGTATLTTTYVGGAVLSGNWDNNGTQAALTYRVSHQGVGNTSLLPGTQNFQIGSMEVSLVPEPATLGLIGLAGLGMLRRRRMA